MLLIQKLDRALFNIGGVLMAALLVWAAPAMAEETLPADDASGVESAAKSAPCKGLKPYNNLDELLYQFYINLDSDCLFKMSVIELEEIWDTKILFTSWENFPTIHDGADFEGKPYKTERDAFYIEAIIDATPYINRFKIHMTRDQADKKGALYPHDGYPQMLPKPNKSVVFHSITYTWYNSDNTREMFLIGHFRNERVTSVSIHNFVNSPKNSDNKKR